MEQIETEYWAHFYHAHPVQEEIEDEDFDMQAELDRINAEAERREAEAAGHDEDDWETVIDSGQK